MKSSSGKTGIWKAGLMMWRSGEVAMHRVIAQRKRGRDRRVHLVSYRLVCDGFPVI
jgi:hypothetical protein